MSSAVLVLDADGVFLDERPYWDAALATALLESGLGVGDPGRWDALADEAFARGGLQRVTKRRGCNSNHDLAVVLAAAVDSPATRGEVAAALGDGRHADVVRSLARAADALAAPSPAAPGADPLAAFGIARDGARFARVAGRFQRVVEGREPSLGRRFPREALREDRAATLAALRAVSEAGFALRVCTGRPRDEIDGPLARLGLAGFLPPSTVTSADEVARAEALEGERGLGKPHAFPLLCALVGLGGALGAIRGGVLRRSPRAVYVGDSPADAMSCERAAALGADVRYVHVRSPASEEDAIRAIAARPVTIGVVDRLAELPGLLAAVPSR